MTIQRNTSSTLACWTCIPLFQ